jgi:hypothetical protein
LWDVYYDTLATLKPHGIPVDREQHKRKIKPHFRGWVMPDDSHMANYSVIVGTEKELAFWIDADTGDILSYDRRDVFESGPPMVRPDLVPLNSKPKLTPEEVKEIAKKYLFLNTRLPLKEYDLAVKYDSNLWAIRFTRTLRGHPFEYDAIHMDYSETFGLLGYRNRLFSDECDVDEKVTEEAAWAAADKHVEAIMEELKGLGVKAVTERGKGPYEHALKIVNPVFAANHKPRPWLDANITLDQARKTRLAWVFIYWSKSGSRIMMYVYIDAIDGKLLGYHYMLRDEG